MADQDITDEARRADTLDRLGQTLASKRAKAIGARVTQGIDERWYHDVEAYEGRDEVTRYYAGLRATVQGYVTQSGAKTQTRSKLIINVTRPKVNSSAAQLQDIALPTDDRNWDLRHSTVPELVEKMGRKDIALTKNGQPVMINDGDQQRPATMGDIANTEMEETKKRAIAMRDEIDDQLDISAGGCGYEGVIREMMFDESLLGVGIIKGPVLTSRVKKVWMPISNGKKTVHVLQRLQDKKPGSQRVNPWDIYPHPECGENAKKFPIWERIPGVTAADIRGYADIDGYIRSQIKKVLMEGPRKPDSPADKPGIAPVVTDETVFEGWEYHGDLTRDELEAAGCTCSEDDVFTSYSASVIMVNDTVIKADIEILETGEMPYDFFVTNKCSGSWAGYGVAFLSRSAQKVITAGWRTMLDNMGLFSGPQVVMKRKGLEPADGICEIRGTKLWYDTSDGDDVQKAFQVYEISAHQQDFANVIKMGMDFLDNETALPQIMQGEQGNATDVLGGMNILLNQSNVMQRRRLKCFDDQVTIPHIGRYVDWNMQYNPKSEIKGDFEVQARASGALMDTEIQNKMIGGMVGLATNPMFAYGIKKWNLVRRFARAGRFDPEDLIKTDEEIAKIEEEMKQQQPPVQVQVAQIREQGAAEREKMESQQVNDRIVAEASLVMAKQNFDADQRERDRKNALVIAAIDERLKSTQLTSAEKQNLDNIKATLAGKSIDVNAENQRTAAKLAVQKDMAAASHSVDLHKHRNPKQVIKPVLEPAGRAKPGEAFQA